MRAVVGQGRGFALAIALTSLAAAHPATAGAVCAFPAPPTVLAEAGDPHATGSRLLQVWETPDRRVLWSRADPPGYGDFRDRVAKLAGATDPVRLLRQTRSRNNALVEAHASSWIRPATCLEKLLLQAQDQRIETFATPTEFAAFILRSPDGRRLRAYFYTVNQDGIGRVAPVGDPVKADAAAGWQVLAAMHNHNFHPGDPQTNGPLAPSGPDAQFIRNFAAETRLQAAWITNGLHTAHIPASAFRLFEGPD